MATALRNAVDATVDAVEHGGRSVRNAVADNVDTDALKSDLAKYKDELLSAVNSALSSVKKQGGKMLHRTEDAYDSAKDSTVDAAETAMKYVKAHPVVAIAAVAGVGALVALMMLRKD